MLFACNFVYDLHSEYESGFLNFAALRYWVTSFYAEVELSAPLYSRGVVDVRT